MKQLFLAFIILPYFTVAQDSIATPCNLVKETDPYTKEIEFSTGFISLQNGTSLSISANNSAIDFFFVVPEKCFEDESTVFIYFEGSKVKTTYRNTGSMNCDGNFHFLFRNGLTTPAVLQKLASQNVSSFVFTGNDKKAVTVSLLPGQQQMLRLKTACIVSESKLLLKK